MEERILLRKSFNGGIKIIKSSGSFSKKYEWGKTMNCIRGLTEMLNIISAAMNTMKLNYVLICSEYIALFWITFLWGINVATVTMQIQSYIF